MWFPREEQLTPGAEWSCHPLLHPLLTGLRFHGNDNVPALAPLLASPALTADPQCSPIAGALCHLHLSSYHAMGTPLLFPSSPLAPFPKETS